MNRINGNVTDLVPRNHLGNSISPTCTCWVCQTSLPVRAAFCNECGTIQPSRALDHFTRLGLERRFDIERDTLDGRYAAFSRVFEAAYFNARGPRQKQLAADHLSAVKEAHTELRCPVRRARYLLDLVDLPIDATSVWPQETAELHDELTNAADASVIDRVAFKARHGMEVALRELAAAFRNQSYNEAAVILARLAQFEDIAATARARRSTM